MLINPGTAVSKSLPIPAAARSDTNGLEMIRVWIAKQKLHTSLRAGFWQDRGLNEADAWGVMLADVIRHVGNAQQDEYGTDPRETIVSIRNALNRELAKPTSDVQGAFVGKRAEK